jgi:hypothetical protein
MNRPALIRKTAFWALLIAIGLTYSQSVLTQDAPFTTNEPQGYYGALTDAFMSGQLNLKERFDPRLLKAKNPYVAQLDVLRPHDASFYKGKFYLYFGAIPVILVYLPWRMVTGTWLSEHIGTVVFCFSGFIMGAALLRRIRDRYLPDCGDHWLWLGIAVIGWGNPVFYLAQNQSFYVVAASAAFFCIMLVAVCTERALASARGWTRCAWIATASLAYGLAIGSRPNFVFGLPVFILPCLYLYVRMRRNGGGGWGPCWAFLAAAILPAATVGAAIATYNFLRFESPFEFGARYAFQGSAGDMRHAKLFGTAFLRGNLFNYLFSTAPYVRYFPFFAINRAYGMALYLPSVLLGPLYLLTVPFWRALRVPGALLVLCVMLLGVFACNLLSLGLFFLFGELRYMADFAPTGLLLGAIAGLIVISGVSRSSLPVRCSAALVVGGLSAFSIVNGSLVALQASTSPWIANGVARCLDLPAYWIEHAVGTTQGALEMKLQFPPGKAGRREPLLSTGLPGQGDIVYIEYLGASHARIGFFHLGAGGPTSSEFTLSPGLHRVCLSLGSLYPPKESPQFTGYAAGAVAALKRHFEVSVDGASVLNTAASFYFATPGLVFVGANPLAGDVSDSAFTGRIASIRRLGLPPIQGNSGKRGESGPLRLHVRFPKGQSGPGEPLVSTGKQGAGDIFFVTYLGGNRIRFGHEDMGSVVTTEPVAIDFDKEHVVDLEMGSLFPPKADFAGLSGDEIGRIKNRYCVRLDGKLLIDVPRSFQPSESSEVVCAFNTIGATTAVEMFSGTIDAIERIKPTPPQEGVRWGPLDAVVIFPNDMTGLAEPLLVTGTAGRGDFLFVQYADQGHVRIGFDHWSVGGALGRSVAVDLTTAHHLEATMGSCYPPAGDREWPAHRAARKDWLKANIQMKLDGAVVFDAKLPTYDARPDQITLWANPIGGSSCRERFTGTVLKAERPSW